MAKRIGLSKKIRFEVFKRDKFTCQYCGKKAPDVVLHVDHIKPVAEGGKNDILNLICACFDCNSGKGARSLQDTTVLDAQRAQMEALQERREQLDMLLKWRSAISDETGAHVSALTDAICDEFGYEGLNDQAVAELRRWLKKYPLSEMFECLDISVAQYLKFDKAGICTSESATKAFYMIPRIAHVRKRDADNPLMAIVGRSKAIMRKRMYVGEREAGELLMSAVNLGVEADQLFRMAANARNWTCWREDMHGLIESLREAA